MTTNRFKFHDDEVGRDIHVVLLEVPRKGSRALCISVVGKFYRVPVSELRYVPISSPISDEKALALIKRGIEHVTLRRKHRRVMQEKRVEIDRYLDQLLRLDLPEW